VEWPEPARGAGVEDGSMAGPENEIRDDAREQQRRGWGADAERWDAWLDWYVPNVKPVTDWICQAVALLPGASVLDMACGPGQPALAAAECVRPAGRVVATDIAPPMLAVAERRAAARGIENIEFRVMDAEELRFADGSFDAVTCAFGLPYCERPVQALAELRRVLRPDGRFAVVVWDERARNPFFGVALDAAGRYPTSATQSVTHEAGPDPADAFRLAGAGTLEGLLRDAGFVALTVERLPFVMEAGSFAEYWAVVTDLESGLRDRLKTLSDRDRERLLDDVRAAAAPYVERSGVRFPAVALGAFGTR